MPISYFSSKSYSVQDPDLRSWNNRLSRLLRTGHFNDARLLFDEMPLRNTITWNSMINGYVKSRKIWKARKLFDEMPERDRDVVSWNLMISGYFSSYGDGLRYAEEGRRLFDQMPTRDLVSWNTVISGYARLGRMDDALCLFNSMPERDVVTWNAILTGFLQNGEIGRAIEWYRQMPKRTASSLSALMSGLIQNDEWDKATEILLQCGKGIDNEREDLLRAYNTLIAGYGQRGKVDKARALFDQIPYYPYRSRESMGFERNVVSWNAMIMCYVRVGDIVSARGLFDQMVEWDTFSWNTIIRGYVQVSDMEQAAMLFSQMPRADTMSWNMMISGYAQSGSLDLALDFFHRTPQKNQVSWNTIIAGCDQNGAYECAIKLFMQMQDQEEKPDTHTLSSILSVSAGLAALDLGRQIHQLITKTVNGDLPIKNSLVTMYSRCGAIIEARAIFDEMGPDKDVITWNAMIGGYASHGNGSTALELFEAMKRKRVQPTYITFISVLNACSHAGLLDKGCKYFASMISDFGIVPRTEHYAALVDIAGRHGQLKEALDFISSMPHKPDKAIWGALLTACKIHKNIELARVAADALAELEPESSASYVLLHNALADLDQWDDAKEVRKSMEGNAIKKERASSWVERSACGQY